MSSISKKFFKNRKTILSMAIKFKCPTCGFEKLIPQSEFQKMTDETFKNNPIFLCNNCNIKMVPITVEVDY